MSKIRNTYNINIEFNSGFWKYMRNMNKRKLDNIHDEGKMKTLKSKTHWSLGLLESMKDPNAVYKETNQLVVIHDKYPKAKIHYLVLPREEISSIYKLDKTHVNLLFEFGKMFEELKENHKNIELCAGFHAVPSMQRLHMHVISTDMDSSCLKTKIHWNSFTTNFFIPFDDLFTKIKEVGLIKRISSEEHKSLMATPLKCNHCNYEPKNMPQLKQHLLSHIKQ